jgi:hypothetical protein
MERKMNHILLAKATLIASFTISIVLATQAVSRNDLDDMRAATAEFQTTSMARAAGYNPSSALDYCYQKRGLGGMGYRYINNTLLDTSVDALHPEALVYSPDQNGSIQLGAVEYLVPATAWDAKYNEPPQLLGQTFPLNETLRMYVFHAWIWKQNPSGTFEDWNPEVYCPASPSLHSSRQSR